MLLVRKPIIMLWSSSSTLCFIHSLFLFIVQSYKRFSFCLNSYNFFYGRLRLHQQLHDRGSQGWTVQHFFEYFLIRYQLKPKVKIKFKKLNFLKQFVEKVSSVHPLPIDFFTFLYTHFLPNAFLTMFFFFILHRSQYLAILSNIMS